MKWQNINQIYETSIQKAVYRIINSEDDHNFKNYFIKNRGIRNHSQNKIGHHDQEMGHSLHTQKSFLYVSVKIYNKLPRNITLIRNPGLFKKWLKRYNYDNSIKIKEQQDNINIDIIQVINFDAINTCQNND